MCPKCAEVDHPKIRGVRVDKTGCSTFGLPPRASLAISGGAARGKAAVLGEHSSLAAGANMPRAKAEAARPGAASSCEEPEERR